MALTQEQKSKLEHLAAEMLDGMEILAEAGVPANHTAIAHLAEGSAALSGLLYPNGEPLAEYEQLCPCGQPTHHGLVN